jgi:hypothetical protein
MGEFARRRNRELRMKRLVFALSALAMACAATTAARADYAVARFDDGWCRVWWDTSYKPWAGEFLWFRHHHHWHRWYYRFETWDAAHEHLLRAIKWNRCKNW